MKPPIEIPRDLKRGDIAICNHGERLPVAIYNEFGVLITRPTKDWSRNWRKDGRNLSRPDERWIVAIERKKSKMAKPDKDAAYLLRISDWLTSKGAKADVTTRLRNIARRLNKETP